MGEYYNWINVDKREYICPADFGYGISFVNQYIKTVFRFVHFIPC